MANFKISHEFLEFLRKKAESLADAAGYNGEMNDGGATRLREAISAYVAGTKGIVPSAWENYVAEYQTLNDPEYSEYVRLRNKFGGR